MFHSTKQAAKITKKICPLLQFIIYKILYLIENGPPTNPASTLLLLTYYISTKYAYLLKFIKKCVGNM